MNAATTNYNQTQQGPGGQAAGAPTQASTMGSTSASPSDHPNYASGAHPTDAQSTTDPASYGKAAGRSVHEVFKGIHGIGETVRGNILGAVDEAFGDRRKSAQHENVARRGEAEVVNGEHPTTQHRMP